MTELYVRMENPENGYESDSKNAKTLDPNKFYLVKRVSMGGSHTTIFLEGEDKIGFNSVNFEFYIEDESDPEKYISYNIFADPAYNPYLNGDY